MSPYTDYVDYLKYDQSIKSKSLGYIRFRFPSHQKEWLIKKLNEKHKKIKANEIWSGEEDNYHLHLKIVNKECFVIPMKN